MTASFRRRLASRLLEHRWATQPTASLFAIHSTFFITSKIHARKDTVAPLRLGCVTTRVACQMLAHTRELWLACQLDLQRLVLHENCNEPRPVHSSTSSLSSWLFNVLSGERTQRFAIDLASRRRVSCRKYFNDHQQYRSPQQVDSPAQ